MPHAQVRRSFFTPPREAPIRTLSVSLVAVAAILASLAFVRARHEDRRPIPQPGPETAHATAEIDLDGIRAAGF